MILNCSIWVFIQTWFIILCLSYLSFAKRALWLQVKCLFSDHDLHGQSKSTTKGEAILHQTNNHYDNMGMNILGEKYYHFFQYRFISMINFVPIVRIHKTNVNKLKTHLNPFLPQDIGAFCMSTLYLSSRKYLGHCNGLYRRMSAEISELSSDIFYCWISFCNVLQLLLLYMIIIGTLITNKQISNTMW